MALTSTSRIMFYLLGLLFIAKLATSRPQSAIDSQDTTDQENPEVRRMFNSMNGGGSYNNYPASNNVAAATPDERMALNRLQYEMVANYVQNNMPAGTWSDPLYRSPEIKRQVRYRQCYFNPISCFRK
ncbi:unnamed protein product [Diamesa hyperborea]